MSAAFRLALAENVHDSCVTLARHGEVLVHLEFERLTRRKHHRLTTLDEFMNVLALLNERHAISGDLEVIVVRHKVERLLGDAVDVIRSMWPAASVVDIEHLDAHAGYAFASGFDDALVVALDGGGDRRVSDPEPNGRLYHLRDNALTFVGPLFPNAAIGIDGRAWTLVAMGMFDDRYAAGKVMGLGAHGVVRPLWWDKLTSPGFDPVAWCYDAEGALSRLRYLGLTSPSHDADLAATLQGLFTERIRDAIAPYRFMSRNLVLVGGCALNVCTNTDVASSLGFVGAYVPPCPGDEGVSLGALLYRCGDEGTPLRLPGTPYLGLGNVVSREPDVKRVAELLVRGGAVAWHIGRPEAGPRALGHRSLFALPTVENKRRLSEVIKGREPFRPVAPIVCDVKAPDWFDYEYASPHMSFVGHSRDRTAKEAPGVVHVDGTARMQTITEEIDGVVYSLLEHVESQTGCPILINTSLNQAGRPICGTYADSISLFRECDVDALVLDDILLMK